MASLPGGTRDAQSERTVTRTIRHTGVTVPRTNEAHVIARRTAEGRVKVSYHNVQKRSWGALSSLNIALDRVYRDVPGPLFLTLYSASASEHSAQLSAHFSVSGMVYANYPKHAGCPPGGMQTGVNTLMYVSRASVS